MLTLGKTVGGGYRGTYKNYMLSLNILVNLKLLLKLKPIRKIITLNKEIW